MPKSTDSSQPAPVTDQVLCDLADLAGVPGGERELFFTNVHEAVQKARELDGLFKQGLARKKGTALTTAAGTLYKALGSLTKNERDFIQGILSSRATVFFDRISSGGEKGLLQIAYQLALLISFATNKPQPRPPHQVPRPSKRGKPLGSTENWIFQNFVFDLLTVTDGKLEYNKNRPGTPLVKAVRLLEPHLPEGFLPKRLSKSMLQRVQARYNKVKAHLDNLESDQWLGGP